jgi:hypothetical protein
MPTPGLQAIPAAINGVINCITARGGTGLWKTAGASRVYAQAAVYYNPYGQGPYGEYSQGYAASSRAKGNMFPSHDGMFGSTEYRYSGYGNVPTGYGHRVDNGINPYVRVYGKSSYYQPSYGTVYVPFEYRGY